MTVCRLVTGNAALRAGLRWTSQGNRVKEIKLR